MASLTDFSWPEGVRRGFVNRDPTATGVEILRMGQGFKALPVDPDKKSPLPFLTPHGVNDATADPATYQQWMAVAGADHGLASLAIVPGPHFVILDDDTGTLDFNTFGLEGTFTEITRRGRHAWGVVPPGRHLRKSRLLDGTGDVIAGDRAYAVMSPSANYAPLDIEAPVLTIPMDSPVWQRYYFEDSPALLTPTITNADRLNADRLVEAMRKSTDYAPGIRAVLSGDPRWPDHFSTAQDHSESGRDFELALAATHFLRGNPQIDSIIFALLDKYSRKGKKSHNREKYLASVVSAALASREQRDKERLTELARTLKPEHVLDGTPPTRGRLIDAIRHFATSPDLKTYNRDEGWRRVPVDDLASVYGVNRKTIGRALASAEQQGVIERKVACHRHDGTIRRDSLVRLAITSSGGAP